MVPFRKLAYAAAMLSLCGFSHAQTPAEPAPATAAMAAPSAPASGEISEGKIAYYGKEFAGRRTASGERFDPGAMTMAHKTLPFGTRVKVTNLATERSVVVRVNDRGPTTADRIGDVSSAAARQLRMLRSGVVDAKLEVVGNAPMRKAN